MNKEENKIVWKIYSSNYGGGYYYVVAKTAKEAIDKFEDKFRHIWSKREIPYNIELIQKLGNLHE